MSIYHYANESDQITWANKIKIQQNKLDAQRYRILE